MNCEVRLLPVRILTVVLAGFLFVASTKEQEVSAPGPVRTETAALELSDEEVENIVRRS